MNQSKQILGRIPSMTHNADHMNRDKYPQRFQTFVIPKEKDIKRPPGAVLMTLRLHGNDRWVYIPRNHPKWTKTKATLAIPATSESRVGFENGRMKVPFDQSHASPLFG